MECKQDTLSHIFCIHAFGEIYCYIAIHKTQCYDKEWIRYEMVWNYHQHHIELSKARFMHISGSQFRIYTPQIYFRANAKYVNNRVIKRWCLACDACEFVFLMHLDGCMKLLLRNLFLSSFKQLVVFYYPFCSKLTFVLKRKPLLIDLRIMLHLLHGIITE